VGIDPYRFIEETDQLKKTLVTEAVDEALAKMQKRDHNLAIDIANQVGKLLEG
jgi:hypothetical protein